MVLCPLNIVYMLEKPTNGLFRSLSVCLSFIFCSANGTDIPFSKTGTFFCYLLYVCINIWIPSVKHNP